MAEPEIRRERIEETTVKQGPWPTAAAARMQEFPIPLISWSSIFAGVFVALAVQLILTTLGSIIGLSTSATAFSTFTSIWAAISGVIALFLGGWISGRMSAFGGIETGLFHGVITWSLLLLVVVTLSAFGSALAFDFLQPFFLIVGKNALSVLSWTFVGMLLSLAAVVIGSIIGGVQRRNKMT